MEYKKRQQVEALDFNNGFVPKLDADGKKTTRWEILPDYDRMLRQLMMDGHAHHRSFKSKRLAKEMTSQAEARVAGDVSEVA